MTDPWPSELVELYRREYDTFVRLAYLLVGSTAAAEEIVQDAFVEVRRRGTDVHSSVGGYVRTTVLNGARARLRRSEVEQRHRPDPPPPRAPHELIELRDAVLRLPWTQRCAIVLR